LSDYAIRLKPEVEYEWTVSLIQDPAQRSSDVLAGGVIRHVEASPKLQKITRSVSEQRLPFVYAEEGLWYDAIASVSDLIETNPNDAILRKQRAALLQQVGLSALANKESGLANNKGM
jgi:hypothetical protein